MAIELLNKNHNLHSVDGKHESKASNAV